MDASSNKTDEMVVHSVRTHNQELYAVLVTRYEHKLLRYATNLIHDEQAAKDVVQESFIKAFVNLKGFDTKKKFSSWIYRITHNEAMNVLKKYRKVVAWPEDLEVVDDQDIEKDFMREETGHQVQECLTKIPLIYSEPLMLRYLEERSYDEISDILRIPIGTVGTRINRAKILMKQICQHH